MTGFSCAIHPVSLGTLRTREGEGTETCEGDLVVRGTVVECRANLSRR